MRPRTRHYHHDERPLAVVPADTLHPLAGHQGSYVAVSGTPGRGAVHVVENVPGKDHSIGLSNWKSAEAGWTCW